MRPYLALAFVYAALVVPAILSGRGGTPQASDQNGYHLPTIATMAEQWPAVDLVDYRSATAPAYHLAMAGLTKCGVSVTALRLTNGLVGLLLVLVAACVAGRFVPPGFAVAAVAPMMMSPSLLGSAIWLNTDNAALVFVLLAVGGAATAAPTTGRLLRWGGWVAAAVAIRQIHVWSITSVAVAALAGPRTAGRIAAAAAACLAVAAMVGVMFVAWGGMTPAGYRSFHDAGANPATFAFAMGLTGLFVPFFVTAAWSQLRAARRRAPQLALAIAASVAPALVVPTAYNLDAGRWGGWLWRLIEVTPSVADRSLLLVALAACGGAGLWALTRGAIDRGNGRAVAILLLSMLGCVTAQAANSMCFQRYHEVVILAALAWLAAMAGDRGARWWIGPLILAAVQAIAAAATLYRPMIAA